MDAARGRRADGGKPNADRNALRKDAEMNSDRPVHTLEVSRRRFLRSASLAAGAGVLLGAGLAASSAAADTKFAQKVAQYQPTPKGASRCDNCSQFQGPSACKVVAGKVSPSGWCQLYAVKS
jgi:hypothetical protein